MAPKTKSKSKSKSSRAGVYISVGRVHRILKKGNFAPRVGTNASIYLAAVVEYLASEILELGMEVAEQNNKSRLSPRHLLFAIRNDEEISRMLAGATISQGGVVPAINAVLLPKKTVKASQNSQSSQQF